MKKTKKIRGVLVASVTPYLSQGVLDEQGIKDLVDYYASSGMSGVLFPSSTGESLAMPQRERIRTVEVAAKHASGRLLILGNASENNWKDAVGMCRHMADRGADVAVCMPPTFFSYSQEELLWFFFRIADNSPIPLVVYNHMTRLPNKIEIGLLMRLREHENIIGMKDTHNDAARLLRLYALGVQEDFSILCGGDSMAGYGALLKMEMLNALCGVCPRLFLNLYEAGREENIKKVALLQEEVVKLMQLFSVLREGTASSSLFSQALKIALHQKGLCDTACAQMGYKLSEKDKARVREILSSVREDVNA